MFQLPIICCNGIGDSLLILGRIPIRILGRLGIRFNLIYESSQHPAKKTLVPFFNEIKYVRYCERAPSKRERFLFQKMMSLSQRVPHIWPVPYAKGYRVKKANKVAPTSNQRRRRVLIQTHLDGHHGEKRLTCKIWSIENWIYVIRSLHDLKCEIAVMEWDALAMTQIKMECPYVTDASQGALAQLCSQMDEFDCVVSVDSWVKYSAAWSRLPQVILVPDVRRNYAPDLAGITADWFAVWWFYGLLNNSKVRVIGLKTNNRQFEFALRTLGDLEPEQLLREIKLQLKLK
jgi:hypothetical protein